MKTVSGSKKHAKKFIANVKKSEIPKALEQLGAVADLIKKEKDFRTFIISPIFGDTEMKKALAFISKKTGASPRVGKYLEYLHCEKALGNLPEIVEIINAIYLEMQKRAKAVVTSSQPITKKHETELKQKLKKVTGRDVEMEFVTDPSLIGGMRIRIGSVMYDSSIKGQLGLLKDKFIEG